MYISWFHFLNSCGKSTRYSDRLYDFSVAIPRCYKDVNFKNFFPCAAELWNSKIESPETFYL